jgi:PIN domain nuclease of toxin-antitoxin system
VLLDTHALLWWALDDPQLSRRAYGAIADAATTVHVSAASAWEIATKVRLGKLPGAERVATNLGAYLARQGFQELPVTVVHGQRAGALPGTHKDPFDRMLIAQAQAENLALVSNETVFDRYGVSRLW